MQMEMTKRKTIVSYIFTHMIILCWYIYMYTYICECLMFIHEHVWAQYKWTCKCMYTCINIHMYIYVYIKLYIICDVYIWIIGFIYGSVLFPRFACSYRSRHFVNLCAVSIWFRLQNHLADVHSHGHTYIHVQVILSMFT